MHSLIPFMWRWNSIQCKYSSPAV